MDELVALWVYGAATDYRPDSDTFIDEFENFLDNNRLSETPTFDCDESLEFFWDFVQDANYVLGPQIDAQLMWDYIVGGDSPIALGESPATVLATMENEIQAYLESVLQ